MNFYNLLLGGIILYNYSKNGLYLYHTASAATVTIIYFNSWYKYFKNQKKDKFKIIIIEEHDDEWIEIKNN
jgi:hypothetical protein